MNKKGAADVMGMTGGIIIVAITLIVGLILLQASAQNIGTTNTLSTLSNESLTGVAVNDTAQYITTCRALSSVLVFNATNDVEVDSGNYTVVNNVVNDGDLAVSITPGVSALPDLGYDVGVWTVDASCQPLTYDDNSGSRAIASIIIIMFAVALAVVSMSPVLRSDLLGALGK